jgi:hypothetical protein
MEYFSVTIFAATGIIVGWVALRFNLKTYSLVRDIQRVAESEGTTWTFYGDPRRRFLFLFRPEKLLDLSDSVALRASKETLLDHRKHLWRLLLITWGIMIAAFVLSTGVPLGYALLGHNWHAR